MRHIQTMELVSAGAFADSADYELIRTELRAAIDAVVWPPGNNRFTIHPQSGKRRGEGNGVKPIKEACMKWLTDRAGWECEVKLSIGTGAGAGKLDAIKHLPDGRIYAVEWETGNISSSHRALNKLALGIIQRKVIGGTLILPTRRLYRYLTDRVGNYEELAPYFAMWTHLSFDEGVLNVMSVEHDDEDIAVPRIPKGTDGRALL